VCPNGWSTAGHHGQSRLTAQHRELDRSTSRPRGLIPDKEEIDSRTARTPLDDTDDLTSTTDQWLEIGPIQRLKGQGLGLWRLGFEGESGLGEEPADQLGPVLDALEPVLDDRVEQEDPSVRRHRST
jgi:hypothetical protein